MCARFKACSVFNVYRVPTVLKSKMGWGEGEAGNGDERTDGTDGKSCFALCVPRPKSKYERAKP